MIGRPLIAQDPSRLGIQTLAERKGETRLANAGLAGEQHDLTFAISGPLEALKQKSDFVFATDEWCELVPMESLEAAFGLALADDTPSTDRRWQSPSSPGCRDRQARTIRQAACASNSATTIVAGFGQCLQPCGQIRCLTDDRLLLRRTFADEITHDDDARRDANPRLQRRVRRCCEAWPPHRRSRIPRARRAPRHPRAP